MQMNEIKIPKEFSVYGSKVRVEYDDDRCEDKKAYGFTVHSDQSIILSSKDGSTKLTKQKKELAFIHELMHFILDSMQELELSENEKFVHTLASLIHQAFKTAVYEK